MIYDIAGDVLARWLGDLHGAVYLQRLLEDIEVVSLALPESLVFAIDKRLVTAGNAARLRLIQVLLHDKAHKGVIGRVS